MSRFCSPDRLQAVLAALHERRTDVSMLQIAAAIQPLPPMRNLHRWLATLVRQKQILRVGGGRTTRYKLAETDASVARAPLSPVAEALQVLVSQPLAERMPADYRRIALDAYRPNQTYLLSAETRQRLGGMATRSTIPTSTTPPPNGSAPAQPGGATGASPGGIPDGTTADLSWRLGWLEATLTPNPVLQRGVSSALRWERGTAGPASRSCLECGARCLNAPEPVERPRRTSP